jgi:hypothetical protein
MIKRFSQFIFESKYDSMAARFAKELFDEVKSTAGSKIGKPIIKQFTYDDPLEFTIIFKLVRVEKFEPEKTDDFRLMPWEVINFEKNGFVIDANAFIPKASDPEEPEIEVVVYISPIAEPASYEVLYYKTVDTIRHELEHLLQRGINQRSGHIVSTKQTTRNKANDNYRYFILPDEIPAMVAGLHASAIKKKTPLDIEFLTYLEPFLETGLITQEQQEKIMKTWTEFANHVYPDAKFSKNS